MSVRKNNHGDRPAGYRRNRSAAVTATNKASAGVDTFGDRPAETTERPCPTCGNPAVRGWVRCRFCGGNL